MMDGRALLVGIGSPHGDDRAGWLVAEHVARQQPKGLEVRCAGHPAELLDWLDGLDGLFVCDAVLCDRPPGTWRTWTWPHSMIATARFSGSHDLSLPAALALAAELDRLPAHVEIWAVAIKNAQPLEGISTVVADAAPRIAQQICGAFCHA
jgi:hydrogenase maturation protease